MAANGQLKKKFIMPPFSILDTKQGTWQDRKREWMRLGIESEVGRKDDLMLPQAQLNKLSGGEGFKSGTSIFDPVLCEILYKWFCPTNGDILDPFAGGSVRGIIASKLDFNYTGIDLRQEQINANNIQAEKIIPKNKPTWLCGNSLNVDKIIGDKYFDYVFSCPPYFDLELYSDDKQDLSNMSWEEFKKDYFEIIKESVAKLRPNRFACFVVSEIRDDKGFYRNFVGETINAFLAAGCKFYNEIILVNSAGTLPLRVGKQFSGYRKVGRQHQNVLVFYKGNNFENIKGMYNNDMVKTKQKTVWD